MSSLNQKTRVTPIVTALAKVALAALLAVSASAEATVLLDVVDAPYGVTHTSLSFFATQPTTTISFSGYNIESSTDLRAIMLQLGGVGPNLLGSTWDASGPGSAFAYNPFGEPGRALLFYSSNGYDTFSQSVSLNQGGSYQLSFDSTVYSVSGGNGLRIETNGMLTAPVPEPETYTLMLAGLAGLGAMSRRKRAVTHGGESTRSL
jgi:hypothetical protein